MARTPFFDSINLIITTIFAVSMTIGYQSAAYAQVPVYQTNMRGDFSLGKTNTAEAETTLTLQAFDLENASDLYLKAYYLEKGKKVPMPIFSAPTISFDGISRVLSTSSYLHRRFAPRAGQNAYPFPSVIDEKYIGKRLYIEMTTVCDGVRNTKIRDFIVVPKQEPQVTRVKVEIPPFPPFPQYPTPSVQPPVVVHRDAENRFTIIAAANGHKPIDYENTQRNGNWAADLSVGYDFDGVTGYVQGKVARAPDLPNFNIITTQTEAAAIRGGVGLWNNSLKLWAGPIVPGNKASASVSLGAELQRDLEWSLVEASANTDMWNKLNVSGGLTAFRIHWGQTADSDNWVGIRASANATFVSPALYFVQAGPGLGARFQNGPLTLDLFADYGFGGMRYEDGKEVGGALYTGAQLTIRPKKGGQQ